MSGMWAIGILLGIKLFFVGLIMLMGRSTVRSVAPTVFRGCFSGLDMSSLWV